jgi:hypothetical protein
MNIAVLRDVTPTFQNKPQASIFNVKYRCSKLLLSVGICLPTTGQQTLKIEYLIVGKYLDYKARVKKQKWANLQKQKKDQVLKVLRPYR